MSIRNLKALFSPQSIAVIGATTKAQAPGAVVMKNLLQGSFAGPIMPVTKEFKSVAGVLAYPDVASLPSTPDLALICTPAATIPGLIRDLGEKGTKAVCIMASGLAQSTDTDGHTILENVRAEAKSYGIRILGPKSMGILVPSIGLNASCAPGDTKKGKIAFVSQSSTMCSIVLDWAADKGIGFSHFIHTGESIDVGLGDILDYLGSDPYTRAILLYMEVLNERRNFMSAARAAARNKPILLIKSGRSSSGQMGAISHTGNLAGSELVLDAAIQRAGMLRVQDIDELFGAVETLARSRPTKGHRLGIITNSGSIGTIAADDLADGAGKLAPLPDDLIAKLGTMLPASWSKENPIDICGDANGDRYAKVINAVLDSKAVDTLLVMHAPTTNTSPEDVAEAVIKVHKEKTRASIMTCWVGSGQMATSRRLFGEAGVPTFETPYAAVQGFLHLLEYRKNQEMLMEVPESYNEEFTPDTAAAKAIIQSVLDRGDHVLSEAEAKSVLSAYGIPVVETHIAKSPMEASRLAKNFDGPVALKILSTDIVHKSDVGGVALNLHGPFEVEKAANAMLDRVKVTYPEARIDGFTVQQMVTRRPGTQELIIGVATDPVFGPAIMFGQGGVAVEIINDCAVALPPLNMNLAARLVEHTRVLNLLKGYRGRPPADLDALHRTLIKVSQLIVDCPEITELDINPLRCGADGVLALDASIDVAPHVPGKERLAIRPYPRALEEWFTLTDGTNRRVLLRPIRPEDEPNHHVLVSKLTPEDIRFRFFGLVHELPHTEMARLTQIDYDREMAFIGEITHEDGSKETLGVVRTVTDPDNEKAEFAVLVQSCLKGSGLGKRLLVKMIEYCRSRGTDAIVGQVLKDNTRMLKFVEHLGFVQTKTVDGDIVEVEYDLKKPMNTEPEPPENG